MTAASAVLAHLAALTLLPPLLLGVIGKTKAGIAGRQGPPLFQPYFDVVKLLNKGAVYSRTTTWMFRAGPVISLAVALIAGLLTPLGAQAPVSFQGDAVLFAYLLGLGRFVTVAAALDCGSSFEGMGASREVAFASLAEPALITALAALAQVSGSLSLSGMFGCSLWRCSGAALVLAAGSLFVVVLAENSRIPVDDPATHLELTMIHEAMTLDHGGPNLAFISYGSAMKLFLTSSLLVRLTVSLPSGPAGWALWTAGVMAIAVAVGLVESSMARLRLVHVPQLLVASLCAAAFGLILALR